MKTLIKTIFYSSLVLFLLGGSFACKNKKSSVAKIFVRSSSNELLTEAQVVIVADVENNDSNLEYVDTISTNSSGFAQFFLSDYFDQAGKEVEVAYFNIISSKGTAQGAGEIRTRVHTTSVETVYLQ